VLDALADYQSVGVENLLALRGIFQPGLHTPTGIFCTPTN
jgi:5,10-methylenetetrahydrofolate reductase